MKAAQFEVSLTGLSKLNLASTAIIPGTVKAKDLTEGVDFTVNYVKGEVTILKDPGQKFVFFEFESTDPDPFIAIRQKRQDAINTIKAASQRDPVIAALLFLINPSEEGS